MSAATCRSGSFRRSAIVSGSPSAPRRFTPDLRRRPIRADVSTISAYVGNDPVNKVDPTGLSEVCWNVDDSYSDGDGNWVVGSRRICADTPETPGRGGGGGGGESPGVSEPDIVVTYRRRRQSLSNCLASFAGEASSQQGQRSFDFSKIEFIEMLDSQANWFTRRAYRSQGIHAVAQFNRIYVRPEHWETYTNPVNREFWHEIAHTQQFHRMGAQFYVAYGQASARAALRGGNPHSANSFEVEAETWGRLMAARYREIGGCAR